MWNCISLRKNTGKYNLYKKKLVKFKNSLGFENLSLVQFTIPFLKN